ncbi:MAG: hypothetical protein ACRCVE_10830 [Plesiomonas sp.]
MTYWPVFIGIVFAAIFGFGLSLKAYPQATLAISAGSIGFVGVISKSIEMAFIGGIPLGLLILLGFAGYKYLDI